MDFMEVPMKKRNFLEKRYKLSKKDTLNSDEEEKMNQPFFVVSEKDGKICVSNSQILELIVNKTPE